MIVITENDVPLGEKSMHSSLRNLVTVFGPPVVSTVVFLGMASISGLLYDFLCPGVPDSGQVPVGAIPWYFLHQGAPVLDSFDVFCVWASACVSIVLPPTIAMAMSRRPLAFLLSAFVTAAIVAYGWFSLLAIRVTNDQVSNAPLRLTDTWPGFIWVFVLALVGLCLGLALRALRYRRDGSRS